MGHFGQFEWQFVWHEHDNVCDMRPDLGQHNTLSHVTHLPSAASRHCHWILSSMFFVPASDVCLPKLSFEFASKYADYLGLIRPASIWFRLNKIYEILILLLNFYCNFFYFNFLCYSLVPWNMLITQTLFIEIKEYLPQHCYLFVRLS